MLYYLISRCVKHIVEQRYLLLQSGQIKRLFFSLSEVKQDSHKNNTAKNFLALLDITELLEMVFSGITLDYFTNNI